MGIRADRIRSKGAVPALPQAFRDQEWRIRSNVAYTLGEIGESAADAVPALIQALQDGVGGVRASAAEALGKIGTPEAIKAAKGTIPDLIQLLQD